MTKKQLIQLCSAFHRITKYPIAIFENKEVIYTYGFELEYSTIPFLFYLNSDHAFQIHWFDNKTLVAQILVKNTDFSVLIGPNMIMPATENEIKDLLLKNADFPLTENYKILTKFFLSLRITNVDNIMNYSDFIYLSINRDCSDVEITSSIKDEKVNRKEDIDGKPIENVEVFYSEGNSKYVQKLIYLIKNGFSKELEDFIKNEHELPYGNLGPNILRHQKNSCIISVYIVRKAAEEGGLDESICIRLAESYVQQFEYAQNTAEVYRISKDMMRDYCQRVCENHSMISNNPIIQKVILYIHNHRMEKIDAHSISNRVGISYSYLCSLFKKETGMSIITFIQKEKIETAKLLLVSSELPLSEIAEYLSFSSQSYFQTIFKKLVFCTPMEYRSFRFTDGYL